MMMNSPKIDNVGIITTQGPDLVRVTGVSGGLVYCQPIAGPYAVRVCLPDQFWCLLDRLPD
jgi:hypothetical protein